MIKFSVLIPTFNRAEYLKSTLDTCLNQEFNEVEFIVIDDCSNDNTDEVVYSFLNIDPRFRYVKNSSNIGMLMNFETGLQECKGEYILVLGSDDGLMPNSLSKLAELINSTGAELITWPTAAYFYAGTKMPTSQLVYPKTLGAEGYKWLSSEKFITRHTEQLAYVGDEECPMLYVKSVASKSLVEAVIKKSGGKFYSCSTPDGYSAFAFLCETDKYLYSHKPFSLHGVSPSSAGVNYVQRVNKSVDLSSKFFEHSKKRKLHPLLASSEYSPLISVMTADFIMTAQDVIGSGDYSIDIKNLICKACDELCDGLMDTEKVKRELNIIEAIANIHGLNDFFLNKITNSYRNSRDTLEGDAISPKVKYFNTTKLNINNVYEASLLVFDVLEGKKKLSFSTPYFIFNSLQYYLKGKIKTKVALKEFL